MSVKEAHESIAATMDRLAERGGEHAERRRRLAEQARVFAEVEASHLMVLLSELDHQINVQHPTD